MRLARAEVRVHRGVLPAAMGNARQSWSERASLLLHLEDEQGNHSWSEASPLPGYGPATDTAPAARAALDEALCEWALRRGEPDEGPLEARVRRWLSPHERSLRAVPSARFALECGLLALWAQREGRSVASLLGEGRVRALVPTSGLLDAGLGPDETQRAARALLAASVRTAKLKVGAADAGERASVEALCALRPEGLRVRLDANQTYTLEQAREALAHAARAGVELVEEPCLALEALGETLPLALDESLWPLEPGARRERLGLPGVRAAVLKPALYGGLLPALAVARDAWALGRSVLWSHALEGPLAMSFIAELALVEGGSLGAAGLDRHGALAAWPELEVPTLSQRGEVRDVARVGTGVSAAQCQERLGG